MKMISKLNPDPDSLFSPDGAAILIDKPIYWTSFKVIHELRKQMGIKKAGHAGTLDPLATGMLIVCTNRSTKILDKYQELPKVYSGSFCLGQVTPSMDLETEVSEKFNLDHLTEESIRNTIEFFTGEIYQIPPMYSAISYKGKKLYDLARKGSVVERNPRQVHVSRFLINKIELPYVEFEIECSKGTYIRVLASDFGQKLGCGAYLSSLRRESIGEYSVEYAFTPDELFKINKTICSLSYAE